MPDIYRSDDRETVANGIRAVKLDPTIVLMTMAAATSRLGLGSTYSTIYYEPFHVRYDRADEFMEVATGLWDSWDDDALIVDKETGPLRRSAEGVPARPSWPVLPFEGTAHRAALGAGPSGAAAGRAERPRHGFAACWAELVFAAYPSLEAGRRQYAYLKSEVEKAGRDPALVKIAPAVRSSSRRPR